MRADAVLFDKDGTLFNFAASWNAWGQGIIRDLARGDASTAQRLARALGYDLEAGSFLPHSFAIAGTHGQVVQAIAEALPQRDLAEIAAHLMQSAARAPMVPAVPLPAFLAQLAHRGMRLGVITNDAEAHARAHLGQAGVEQCFDFIAGFDSGYAPKPNPAALLAFAKRFELRPDRVVMVGDSPQDLTAGRRAGMQTVGVLTGLAPAAALAPNADAVLADIGDLTDWLWG
ncbi:MAG: HAD family hydrolase [Rhodobacteraceae bacterium]|nr:HAD family hydrolase [Paracoccaceae bacterium]